jgi:hypothetical protein
VHLTKRVIFGASVLGAILIGWAVHMLRDASNDVEWSSALPLAATVEMNGPAGAPATPFVTTPREAPTTTSPSTITSPSTAPGTPPIVITVGPKASTDRSSSSQTPASHVAQPTRTKAQTPMGIRRPTQPGGTNQSNPPRNSWAPQTGGTANTTTTTTNTTNTTIIASGDNIVIATDGSIVTVGDNPVVRANTGNATSSSVIAVDTQDTTMSTGDSAQTSWGASSSAPGSGSSSFAAAPTGSTGSATASSPPIASGGRAVGIAGYEDQSLRIAGNDNILTYDDSNVFVDRNGTLNGNTGDTDTSGLNVVDSVGSTVRTGDSVGTVATANTGSNVYSNLPIGGGNSATVTGPNGTATASAQDALVIGGDGLEDRSVSILGDRNVATSDDGNTTIGGTGDVNAQIGDSATSGAVVMGIRDSVIVSGDSAVTSTTGDAP